jgi:uncharacterized repeat protein (TIGR02543 family)
LNYTDAPNPPKPQEIDAGDKVTPPSAPTREGYTFGGWFLDAAGTGAAWDFGNDTVKKDVTLYAKWMHNYTVTFDLNYTGAANPPANQEIDEGGKVTQPAVPTREGYTFGGWFTDAAGTGAAWDFDTDTVKEAITLYGTWTRNTYKVTFYTGDAEYTPVPLENVLYEDKITAPVITKTGYTLDGWYKEAAKTTKWDFGNDTVKENITLYAAWTRNSYTVTFDLNGAPGTAPAHPAVLYEGKITRPSPDPTREGFAIDGWYRNAEGTGAAWDFDLNTVTENITLYAKWAVWLESKLSSWTVTTGSAVSIVREITTESEYTSYTDETHYTYKESYQIGTTIYEYEMSRNGESAHEVDILDTVIKGFTQEAEYGRIREEGSHERKQ